MCLHISLAVSSCLYMADANSEKKRRSRGFELACVEREGGRQQREEAAKPRIRAGMCGAGRRTPTARRSGEAADSSWHVWSGKADANSEKERRSRGFELACVEREGGGQQREEAAKPWIRAGMEKAARFRRTALLVITRAFYYYSAEIAPVGHAASHAPQSTHASASISYLPSPSEIAPTGHSPSQEPQLTHSSLITCAIV